MKKIYAIILLLSFLTGAIQPIVPLLEYHFFEESIIELFCVNRDVPESDCDGICYLTSQIEKSQERQSDSMANHVDYYPGTVFPNHSNTLFIYPEKSADYIRMHIQQKSVYSITDTPPPKIS